MTDTSQVAIPDLLAPYKTIAIAKATGVGRAAVSSWRTGRTVPDVRALPPLAAFLGVDLGVLTEMVAAELNRRDAEAVA